MIRTIHVTPTTTIETTMVARMSTEDMGHPGAVQACVVEMEAGHHHRTDNLFVPDPLTEAIRTAVRLDTAKLPKDHRREVIHADHRPNSRSDEAARQFSIRRFDATALQDTTAVLLLVMMIEDITLTKDIPDPVPGNIDLSRICSLSSAPLLAIIRGRMIRWKTSYSVLLLALL